MNSDWLQIREFLKKGVKVKGKLGLINKPESKSYLYQLKKNILIVFT